jgi:hypothetical protein
VILYGLLLVRMFSNTFGERRSVWFPASYTVLTSQVKVGRLINPLGTPITSPLVFGSHLLSLTEDGRNLLTWDVSEEGMSVYYFRRDRAECL